MGEVNIYCLMNYCILFLKLKVYQINAISKCLFCNFMYFSLNIYQKCRKVQKKQKKCEIVRILVNSAESHFARCPVYSAGKFI